MQIIFDNLVSFFVRMRDVAAQAGVALGMALVVQRRNPEIGIVVLPVVIAATVLFEIVGPVLTRLALRRVGEVPDGGIPNP